MYDMSHVELNVVTAWFLSLRELDKRKSYLDWLKLTEGPFLS